MVWYYRSGDANGLTTEHTELAEVLPKTTLIYRRKPYPEPISKADTKPVTVNIAVISAVGTHFYM
jgi:hypothetical protein